ncbi:Protein argonaute [Elasticomyces elasticus]|nr:Protein argonaute [Elasticomyces elasticus]KAK4964566.1 Protein argonaute [Elasticomyces elasticus]
MALLGSSNAKLKEYGARYDAAGDDTAEYAFVLHARSARSPYRPPPPHNSKSFDNLENVHRDLSLKIEEVISYEQKRMDLHHRFCSPFGPASTIFPYGHPSSMQYQQQMRPPHGQPMPPPPQHSRSAIPMQIAAPFTFRPNTSMPAPISLLNKHSEANTTEHDIAHSLSRSAVLMQGAMHAITPVPASPALAFCRFYAERGAPPATHCLSLRWWKLPDDSLPGYGSSMDERKSFNSRKNQLSETALSRFLQFQVLHIVDLDLAEEGGKPKKSGKENKHRIVIKQINTIGFQVLASCVKGGCDFDNSMLESINFFDHCGLAADHNTIDRVPLLWPIKQVVANSQNSSSKSNQSWRPLQCSIAWLLCALED